MDAGAGGNVILQFILDNFCLISLMATICPRDRGRDTGTGNRGEKDGLEVD